MLNCFAKTKGYEEAVGYRKDSINVSQLFKQFILADDFPRQKFPARVKSIINLQCWNDKC
jgi:hypothetical protein